MGSGSAVIAHLLLFDRLFLAIFCPEIIFVQLD
jgi:hypothetical protein